MVSYSATENTDTKYARDYSFVQYSNGTSTDMKIEQRRFMKTDIPRDKKYSPRKLDITRGNKIFTAEMICKNIPCNPKIFLIAQRYSLQQ